MMSGSRTRIITPQSSLESLDSHIDDPLKESERTLPSPTDEKGQGNFTDKPDPMEGVECYHPEKEYQPPKESGIAKNSSRIQENSIEAWDLTSSISDINENVSIASKLETTNLQLEEGPQSIFIESLRTAKANLKSPQREKDDTMNPNPEAQPEPITSPDTSEPLTLEALQRERLELRSEVTKLRIELRDAHDFIFSMQPSRNQITSTEAISAYKSLILSIEDWVSTTLGDALQDCLIMKHRPEKSTLKDFMAYVNLPGQETAELRDTDEYNVMAMVMKYLYRNIFNKDFYCPVEPGAMEYLNTVLTGMRNLEPRKDMSTWRRWRSETLAAVSNRHEFPAQLSSFTTSLTHDLATMLHIFCPQSPRLPFALSIKTSIIEPALKLAHKLHLSIDKYTLEYTSLSRTPPKQRPSSPSAFKEYECVDLMRAGRVIKEKEFVDGQAEWRYCIDIAPAMVFEETKADAFAEGKTLLKAKCLVFIQKEEEEDEDEEEGYPSVLAWAIDKLGKRR